MNNETEKINPPSLETNQEQVPALEQLGAEREITEAELQENIERVNIEVDNEQVEIITGADKRIENVPSASGLSAEKAATIYEKDGFAEKVDITKEQIKELGAQTQAEIKNLTSQPPGESETERKYKSVREYSKEETPEERRALAEKIHELRHEHFQSSRELEERISGLFTEAETGKLAAEEAVTQGEALGGQLLKLKEGLISRVVNFREIRRLEEQIGAQKINQEKFDEQYKNAMELVSNLEAQKGDRNKLEQAKGLLRDFYTNKGTEWITYEKEEQERNVSNVLEKYNVTMVHTFMPRGVPSDNSLLRSDISWEEKLKIVLAFEPTISTSAISPEQQGMWTNIGVLLNGGRVEVASPSDAGTRTTGIGKREMGERPSFRKPIEQQLQDTTSYHHKGDLMNYNEIVVSNPEVAGFFVKVEDNDSIANIGVSPDKVFSAIEGLHIPMFAVKNGEVYKVDGQEKVLVEKGLERWHETILKLGEKVTPAELAQLPAAMNKERKEQLATELMEDSPFKLSMKEARLIDSRNAGKETYIGVNFDKLATEKTISQEIYKSSGKYERYPQLVGEKITMLGEIKSPVAVYRLFSAEGHLYNQTINKKTGKIETNENLSETLQEGNLIAYIDYNQGYGYKRAIESPINSTDTYIEKMKYIVNIYQEKLIEARQDNWNDGIASYEHRLREAAFHLYGFTEEATQRGDVESQEVASRLASEIFSRGEYQEIVQRRVGPNGEFRITKEDLESA